MLREGGLALGRPKWRVIATVIIPAALSGIISGVMLDLARVAGETAPLLFTALNNQYWSNGWNQPTATLPVMIFTYAISPYPDWHRQAWAAGFILLMVVLAVNLVRRDPGGHRGEAGRARRIRSDAHRGRGRMVEAALRQPGPYTR